MFVKKNTGYVFKAQPAGSKEASTEKEANEPAKLERETQSTQTKN